MTGGIPGVCVDCCGRAGGHWLGRGLAASAGWRSGRSRACSPGGQLSASEIREFAATGVSTAARSLRADHPSRRRDLGGQVPGTLGRYRSRLPPGLRCMQRGRWQPPDRGVSGEEESVMGVAKKAKHEARDGTVRGREPQSAGPFCVADDGRTLPRTGHEPGELTWQRHRDLSNSKPRHLSGQRGSRVDDRESTRQLDPTCR